MVIKKFFSQGRVRAARKELAARPTARNYARLAHEYGVLGKLEDVLRVCEEGLKAFPGDIELKRLGDRGRKMRREGRTRELLKEIREAPRAALWRELCELYLESAEARRAEELAKEWYIATKDGEAQLYRAQARSEVFFTDRRRDDGRFAFDLVQEAEDLLPADPRPLRLRLKLASSCGAWKEARRVLVRLLEATPGDPVLEGRFRRILSLSETSPTLDQALREVERTGLLVDEDPVEETQSASVAVRPVLKELVTLEGVKMAAYVRGGTCLVQGPKGATADRTARSLRDLVQTSRTAGRRLGLGQTLNVYLEGDFGHLMITPGEQGAGALWSTDPIRGQSLDTLRELAGIKNASTEVDE